jgi:hypothetical protein
MNGAEESASRQSPLTAPVHPPIRVTGPPELHHSKGRYPGRGCLSFRCRKWRRFGCRLTRRMASRHRHSHCTSVGGLIPWLPDLQRRCSCCDSCRLPASRTSWHYFPTGSLLPALAIPLSSSWDPARHGAARRCSSTRCQKRAAQADTGLHEADKPDI